MDSRGKRSLGLQKEKLNRRREEGWRRWRRWRWRTAGRGGSSDRARREAERGWQWDARVLRGVRLAFPGSQRLPKPPGPHPSALSRLTRPPRAACGGSASPAASVPPPSFSKLRRPAEVRLTTQPALRPGSAPAASRSPLSAKCRLPIVALEI